jgi:hypothetical protein
MAKKLALGAVFKEFTTEQIAELDEIAKAKGFKDAFAFILSLVKGQLFLARLEKADSREAIAAQLDEEFNE